MKSRYSIILITMFLYGLIMCSCSKDGGNCISSSGQVIQQDRQISDFDSIRALDNVNVILKQDPENKVTVEAGEHIIGGITTELSGRELVLRNTNTCNWFRSYSKPINVYVSVKNLRKIHYESSGNITCTDTIRSEYLKIDLWGGCGTIDLKVHLNEGFFIQHLGTATVILNGVCNISSVFAGDYGLLQLTGLKTGYTYVTNRGTNDCYVRASTSMEATIGSIGNIYYTGNPAMIKTTIEGTGKVIPF